MTSLWHYPRVPVEWRPAFRDYQRRLARQYAVLAAWVTLLMVPLFHVSDWWIDPVPQGFWGYDLLMRLPPLMLAMITLWLHYQRPDEPWPRIMAITLGLTIMLMTTGLLVLHHLAGTEVTDLMVRGLIMTTAAVAIVATAGIRDLAVIYGIPFAGLLILLASSGTDSVTAMGLVIHPLMMAVIGCIIAEVLFISRVRAFNDRQKLHHNAMTDPLTGLLNRRAMEGQLQVEHAHSSRHDDTYALVMADLDRFKHVNDTYGHDVGDEVLRDLAERMQASVRMEDAIARWGGEEFLILLRATGSEEALIVAEKIRQKVNEKGFYTGVTTLPITVSLGVGVVDGDPDPGEVIKRADQALYRAKENGRDRVEILEQASDGN